MNSCSYLALQADGREVTTVEGLADGDDARVRCSAAFLEEGGVQCGFCTPGMLDLGDRAARRATRRRPRTRSASALSGNLCRCTGYDGIVKAVLRVAGSA